MMIGLTNNRSDRVTTAPGERSPRVLSIRTPMTMWRGRTALPELRALTVNLIATELFRGKRARKERESGTPTGTVRGRRVTEKLEGRQRAGTKRDVGGVDGTRTRGLRRDRHESDCVNDRAPSSYGRCHAPVPRFMLQNRQILSATAPAFQGTVTGFDALRSTSFLGSRATASVRFAGFRSAAELLQRDDPSVGQTSRTPAA